jgi:hypothetical protein
VPFLAAHINYDNLFFLAIGITLLLSVRLLEDARRRVLDAQNMLLLVATLCLSCLIKYPFLPICAVTVLFLAWRLWRYGLVGRAGLASMRKTFGALTRLHRVLLIVLVVVSAGLFTERYIANLVTYHNPVPACDAVISQDECVQYGPYGRDHLFAQEKPADFHPSLLTYLHEWLYGMWYRLFFAVNYDYATSPPLYILSRLAVLMAVGGAASIILRLPQLLRGHPVRQLIACVTVGYVAVLFVDGFSAYAKTAQPVAINGRYLIPLIPLLLAFAGLAWSWLLRAVPIAKVSIAVGILLVFLLQGGGTTTFLIRSADTWMWDNGVVRSVNRTARSVAWRIIPLKDWQ